ncbi:TetR/AcrR family transcriptional regulator [Rhizobium sp. TRM95796]|uniref:TetR/AcrR family transcriptional regulator n=1 Tax=Rhizobium sp. TRM95796 TaxID=2979862 RepID=UPI0021E7CADF|nr:TetR/AcrR family transcriptional regulator [Rhizobium sp. TRM95796]MCV3765733.1 TetR/AcrR family transcriptional regulator [Rhizobium sp. TRM95796]
MTKSTDGPRRRRSPKGEHRREEILDAGMRIFARGGYSSASIASVAEEVNLTLPGLLHHFPTKVDLLLAILERRDINSLALVGSLDGNWRETLKGLCRVNRANTEIPGVVRAFSILNAESLIEDHPAVGWFSTRLTGVRERLAGGIRRGVEAGEVRADIFPEDIAAEIIGMMDGLQVLWLRAPGQTDIVAIFDGYIDRLIHDLEVKS